MAIMARFIVLIPLVFSIAGAILTSLALFAGHQKGFMEDYAIVRLNTSMIGHNMIDSDNSTSSDNGDDGDDGGFFSSLGDDIQHTWDDIKNDIDNKLNDLTGDIADELAETLGISEWYSVHVMSACEGEFKPNATASTGLNITNCTATAPNNAFNLTELLDQELSVGPFKLSLQDIDWPSDIQDKLDLINDVLTALFVIYVLGICFSGIGALTSVAGFFLAGKRSVVLVNVAVATLAALCITVASIVVTVAMSKGVKEINEVGKDVGVEAEKGSKFLAVTWAAASLMIVAMVVWCLRFCIMLRESRRMRTAHHKSSI